MLAARIFGSSHPQLPCDRPFVGAGDHSTPAPRQTDRPLRRTLCRAAGGGNAAADQPQKAALQSKDRVKLPARGFFAEADTKAEVYTALGGVNRGSIYKKGGRHAPEFLWNVNWKEQLELEEAVEKARAAEVAREKVAPSGSLSISRVLDLNSIDIDLSEQLRPRPKREPVAPRVAPTSSSISTKGRTQAARLSMRATAGAAAAQRGPSTGNYARMPPRANEEKRWKRSSKFNSQGAPQQGSTPEEVAAVEATVAAERVAYAKLKEELQTATALLGTACFAASYAFYTKDLAASYGLGALGGYIYLRLLHRSVDAFAGEGSGAGSSARLLVPVVLVLASNRWNMIKADDVGLTLQLLPMLLGFFTYKGAMIARGGVNFFTDISDERVLVEPLPEAAAKQ